MEFHEKLKKNTKILMDDIIFICYNGENQKETRKNMEMLLYKVSMKAKNLDIFAATTELRNIFSEMTFGEITTNYKSLVEQNYQPKYILENDGSYENKTLYQIINEMKKGEKIELCINNDTPKTFEKIKCFNFENNDYLTLKDDDSNTYCYKYEMTDKEEKLILVNDEFLLGIFTLLNN